MSKLGRFWEWFLPGLIYLCPIGAGAIAYCNTGAEGEASRHESPRLERPASGVPRRSVVIPLARP